MKPLGRRIQIARGSELDEVDRLPAETEQVQFTHRLTDDQFRHLAELLADRPDVHLRAYGGSDFGDLDFLRFFPSLRSFWIDAAFDGTTSLDGLRWVPDLETLGVGRTRRPLSLHILGDLRHLRVLWIEGQSRDLDVISSLPIETLRLRSITLPDLDLLTHLDRLRTLWLGLGGTSDLRRLPELSHLEELEIWQVRGLTDLTPIGGVLSLRRLFLQALPRVQRLPDLHRLEHLERVTLHTMKGITDLTPLRSCPALTTLMLTAMPQLKPEALRPLVGHPSLRRGSWNIGSMRQTYLAHDVLPIEPEPYGYAAWRAGVPYREILADWTRAVQKGTHEVDGRMVAVDDG